MQHSTQLQIVRVATAISAVVIASIPFVVSLSAFTLLVIVPIMMAVSLMLGAIAENCVMSESPVPKAKPRIKAIKPVLVSSADGLTAQAQCRWFACKCAA